VIEIRPSYQCNSCNALFDEPSIHHYREDMNGEGAFQDFYIPICPCCGSEEIEELPEPDEEEDDEDVQV